MQSVQGACAKTESDRSATDTRSVSKHTHGCPQTPQSAPSQTAAVMQRAQNYCCTLFFTRRLLGERILEPACESWRKMMAGTACVRRVMRDARRTTCCNHTLQRVMREQCSGAPTNLMFSLRSAPRFLL